MKKAIIIGLVVTAVILVLIYRKKIFRSASPALEELKKKILAGEGLQAGTYLKGTEGEAISNMLKDAASKVDARALEAATRDWNKVNTGFDENMIDNFDLISRPVTVNDLLSGDTISKGEPGQAIEDLGRLIRNQVVLNDLWGRSSGCGCGCQGRVVHFTGHRLN